MDLARHVAEWSKDPKCRVGAVIVDEFRGVTLGYNGFPRGVVDTVERLSDVDEKYRLIVHAEVNAVLLAPKTRGCTLYSTKHPCTECAKIICQSGIIEVVSPPISPESDWRMDQEIARAMMLEAGVRARFHKELQ
jgi:dCMP deaminase